MKKIRISHMYVCFIENNIYEIFLKNLPNNRKYFTQIHPNTGKY